MGEAVEGDGASRAKRWPWWHWAILAFILIDLAVGVFFCVGSPGYYSSKMSAAPVRRFPNLKPDRVRAIKQVEPHTCGFCSMAAVYRAYGLDVEELRLRFRLGTDVPVSNFLPDTQGTIHPDMLRVLSQDGFETEVLRPSSDDALKRLFKHLDSGHYALVLVKLKEYHWVVAAGRVDGRLVIVDSLAPQPYDRDAASYFLDEVYSLLLVQPESR